jgi:hypothetical protein
VEVSQSAASLAAPDEEASDEDSVVEASGNMSFNTSPTMSQQRSSKRSHSSEGKITRAKAGTISK